MTAAIQATALSKTYTSSNKMPPKLALDNITITIPKGSFYGLLGPNGAGKSTFINILSGMARKSSGTVIIDGLDIDTHRTESKKRLGVVPQELNVDPFFTPFEALEIYAGLYGVPKKQRRTMEILTALGLSDKANAYARSLSGGMRRRLMVAKALVHTPPILILDEPTAGVDVELRQQLWEYVRGLHAGGTTIVLTTHYLEEAEQLCDTVAIINKGKVVTAAPTRDLLAQVKGKNLTLVFAEAVTSLPLTLIERGFSLSTNGMQAYCSFSPQTTPVGQVLEALNGTHLPIADISVKEPKLEDVFLELTRAS
jgi:ABC-2 type transport system ATP-binding protein